MWPLPRDHFVWKEGKKNTIVQLISQGGQLGQFGPPDEISAADWGGGGGWKWKGRRNPKAKGMREKNLMFDFEPPCTANRPAAAASGLRSNVEEMTGVCFGTHGLPIIVPGTGHLSHRHLL